MFGYVSTREQIIKERQKNADIEQRNEKNAANIDYLAMMCDVDLEDDGEEASNNAEQEI